MATYNDLTAEQKTELAFFLNNIRASYGAMARFLDGIDDLRVHYTAAGVGAIIGSLDAGAVIPNTSGLAGSQPLTKEQAQAAIVDMSNLLTTWWTEAKRQQYDVLAGPPNTGG